MLSQYRVVDLTDERGQLAAHILCALGAEVVLVEPPEGSSARHLAPFAGDVAGPEQGLAFWAYNRGKRSVVIDRSSDAGREQLARLLATADVVIENEAVGSAGAEDIATLAGANERLVHVSITPFGRTGPKARWAASDLTLLAASGALALTGDKDRAPVRFGPAPQAWLHGAAEAAQAALIALFERDHHSGRGQHADVSVQLAANQVAASQMLTAPLGATTTARTAGGVVYGGIDVKLMWPCADGYVSVTFLFGAAIGPFTRRLMEWVHEEGFCDAATRDKDWVNYGTMLLDGREPIEAYEHIRDQVLTTFFGSKTKAELLEAAVGKRLLIAPIATAGDVLASPQLAAREYWERVEVGPGWQITFPGPIAKLSATPLRPLPRPPRLGEHTEEVLATTAATAAGVGPAAAARRPAPVGAAPGPSHPCAALGGLKVLDLMWVMAGPAASRVLADYGADVVRVESSRRIDTARTLAPFVGNDGHPELSGLFNNLNANKRGVALDLTHPASREVVLDLVDWADVVLDAFSPKGMGSLGLGHETLLARRPDLIVASTCLNGQTGPLSCLAGFGTMAAAMSGFFSICGWPDRPPCGPFGAYTDYVAPRYFLCTVLAALEHRRRTGAGQYIDFSQSEASMHNLATVLLDYTANGRTAERHGNDDERFAPHGVYPCAGTDEWVAVACETDGQWRALCALLPPGAAPLAQLDQGQRLARRRELDALVCAWTAAQTADAATDRLQAAGVPAHAVVNSTGFIADPQVHHRGHLVEVPHGKLATTWIEGSRFVLSRTPATMRRAGPTFGEDTFDVLSSTLGYDVDRIADLAAEAILE